MVDILFAFVVSAGFITFLALDGHPPRSRRNGVSYLADCHTEARFGDTPFLPTGLVQTSLHSSTYIQNEG